MRGVPRDVGYEGSELMAANKRPVARKKRSLFRELMSGVEAMRDHREGRLTLKTREVQPIAVPPINADAQEAGVAGGLSLSPFPTRTFHPPRTCSVARDDRPATSRSVHPSGDIEFFKLNTPRTGNMVEGERFSTARVEEHEIERSLLDGLDNVGPLLDRVQLPLEVSRGCGERRIHSNHCPEEPPAILAWPAAGATDP